MLIPLRQGLEMWETGIDHPEGICLEVFFTCETVSMLWRRASMSWLYSSLRDSISLSWDSTSSFRAPFRAVSSRSLCLSVSSSFCLSIRDSDSSACTVIKSWGEKETGMINKKLNSISIPRSQCTLVQSSFTKNNILQNPSKQFKSKVWTRTDGRTEHFSHYCLCVIS